jgi:predicted DCC family thiol-disulfide oxidoreductase YuxK
MHNPVILFDAVCNLCNGAVQYVIKHDKKKLFHFASLQSEAGQRLLQQHGLSPTDFNSFILIADGKVYSKSTAALMVAKQLSGIVQLLSGFIIVPKVIRDAVYNLVAKHRYKMFGKQETCMLPTPELQSRFLN